VSLDVNGSLIIRVEFLVSVGEVLTLSNSMRLLLVIHLPPDSMVNTVRRLLWRSTAHYWFAVTSANEIFLFFV